MIKVEKLIPGGMGLGTAEDGRKIFFWNALPSEVVTKYHVTKQKSRYSEAIADEIERISLHRVEPKDECFLATSPWQIMDYPYELKQKSILVSELFREHGIKVGTPKIISDNHDYFYRNKMEYALYWNNQTNQIDLAFHQRGSHRKFPVTQSSIERPELFARAKEIINDLNARGEEARKYQSLLLRCDQDGTVSGGLYENHKPHPIFDNLKDTILGQEYSYSPNGFFQINLPVYELALQEIKQHITTDEVLDLYAGVGTIGLSVAEDRKLTLVEVDKSAYAELVKNSERVTDLGGIPRSSQERSSERMPREGKVRQDPRCILDKSENVLKYISPEQAVILDPPRAGCDRGLIDKLLEVKPAKIIYLSCNPATQARDIKLLLEKYHLEKVKTFNFFPHTPHIENLAILS